MEVCLVSGLVIALLFLPSLTGDWEVVAGLTDLQTGTLPYLTSNLVDAPWAST